MNKVYRTVFNETTNTWVAVAEISPAKGKKSRSEKSSGGIGLHLMAPVMVSGMLLSGYAMAAPELKNGTGTNAIIVNSNPVTSGSAAAGDDSIAIGTNAKVEGAADVGQSSIAVGSNAKTKAQNNIAIGTSALTENGNTIAVGNAAHAKGQSDLAIGDGAKAMLGQGTAVGVNANATQPGASAYGYLTKATGYLSTAIGNQAVSSGSSSVAVGKALASGSKAIAIGSDAKSTSTETIAVGSAADAGGSQFGIAIGSGAKLNTDPAVTGKNTAIAIGYQAEATDLDANAFGRKANATGQTSLAIGAESAAKGISSIAVGSNTKADDEDGIAIGNKAATGAGHNNTAVGSYSEANVGWSTALGTRAYTNANGALAAGTMASAEGQRATAIGSFSFAEGLTSTALGYNAIATQTATSGTAMGTGTVIDGKMSGAWAAAPHANPHQYDNTKRSIVGGEGNYAIGNENIVGNLTKNSVVFGNKIKIGAEGATLTSTNPAGQGNSIKSREEAVTYTNATALENVVAIGNSSKVTVSNGVALGSNSVADVDKGEEGSDPLNTGTNKQDSTWKATHAAVSVGNGTDVTRQITSVAAGKNDTDAVNVAQLKAAGFELSVSHTGGGISEDKTQPGNLSDKKVKNGETVTIDAGKNIKVTQTGKTISIATKDKVEFTEITLGDATNNTVLTSTADGLDVGGDKIANVAKGTADTDAVNVSQLNTVKNTVEGKLGGFTVGADKNATAAGIDVNKDNARFDVVGADNGKVTTAIDGNKISVDLTADAKASLGKADTAVQGIKVKANGNDVTTLDKDNNTLEITQGDNITVANDNGKVKVSLKSDVAGLDSLTSKVVTAGAGDSQVILNDNGVNVGGNTYISKDGLNANNKKVANVADGDISATSKDAVNGSQLYATNQNVATNATNITNLQNQTFKLQANGDTATAVKASDTVQFLNGENIAITRNGNDITVATKKDLVVDSVKAGDTLVNNAGVVIKAPVGGTTSDVKLTAAGLDNGKNKITNVAAGTDDTDAVNVSQLKAVETKAAVKTKVTAGDGVDVTNTGTADAPNYTVAINQATKDDIAKGVAAKDVVDNKGLTFAGDSGTTGVKKLGDSISVKGDNNITTKADANGVLVTLNKDLNVNSVIANGTKIDDNGLSFVDASGSAVANSPAISKTGINAGNQKITNVAAGTDDTDAVNLAQLKAAKSSTTAGKNITVKTVQNNDGSTSYEVATKDDVTFSKTTVGNVVTDGATGKITGLTAGDVSVTSTDAVNGSQLHATNQNVANNAANIAKGINFGGTTGSNNYRLGDTINVKGDSNITSNTVAGGAQLALNPNLNVTSVTTTDAKGNKTVTNGSGVTITPAAVGSNPVSLTTGGLNNGGNKITNVAAGTAGTDAVNISQLNQALGAITGVNTANFMALENKVNEVAADAKAGTAAAMAVAGLPQAYLPGKSMMAVGGSVYRGESGYAIGYSTISDGGNWIVKGTATGNSRGHYGATAAVGYQW
ncbi:YadA-like family protein [Neisseria elongata]|uniref:YadA-like family protein n=1 Tax=Neisseria elongata TaxID=495 RepID=UPI00195CCBD6|nr:YadA-like family protein [Neisseria elongata]MBM7064176.1 YadA-like family protein [Neisseria elongata]